MGALKQCFCYSLRQGSFVIGTYALVVYCVAFAIELWWIVESLLVLPAPAYTLCALYFFNFIMAAVLLFGLLVRQRKYLMSWTLMTVLSFFPEAGMVLFMSVYYWPLHKEEYGVIELVFWSLRAFFSIFGVVCVCSLYLTWRDEELILGRLHDLTLASVETISMGAGGGMGGGMMHAGTLHRSSRLSMTGMGSGGTLKGSKSNLAYHNFGYVDSSSGGDGHFKTNSFVSRNHFTGSRSNLHHLNSSSVTHAESPQNNLRASLMRMKSEFNPALLFDPAYRKSRISELGIAGIGLEPPGQPPCTSALTRTRSLWNVTNDDYWSRPPPSRPVSLGYVNHVHQMDNHLNNAEMTYQLQGHNPNSSVGQVYSLQQQPPPYTKTTMLRQNRAQSNNALTLGYSSQYGLVTKGGTTSGLSFASGRRNPMASLFAGGARRAQSVDGINIQNGGSIGGSNALFYQRYYGQNITMQNMQPTLVEQSHHPHFHVLNYDPLAQGDQSQEEDWSKSSLQDPDDIRSYQDIPL